MKSVCFHAPGDEDVEWYVQIFPNGDKEEHKGNVSLFVYSHQPPFKHGSMVTVKFRLVDQDTNETLWGLGMDTSYNFPKGRDGWGYSNIPQEELSTANNLVVICTLEYEVEKLETFKSPFNSTSAPADITRHLAEFYSSSNIGDVTLVVKNKEFQAHKAILAARSPVFAAMFQHNMKEAALNRVYIAEMEPDILQAVLRFIYTDQVDLTAGNATALLVAANRYFLDLLKWKCEQFLAQDLSIKNCCERLMLADAHDATNLKKVAGNIIRKSSAELKKTKGWKKMMKQALPELLCEIIESFLPA